MSVNRLLATVWLVACAALLLMPLLMLRMSHGCLDSQDAFGTRAGSFGSVFWNGSQVFGGTAATSAIIESGHSFTSQGHKGIARVKELCETSATDRISVQEQPQEVDTCFANTDFWWQANSLSLNVSQQIYMIFSMKRRSSRPSPKNTACFMPAGTTSNSGS